MPDPVKMGKKRVLIGYGIDVNAVANHINTTVGGKPNLTNVSRGELLIWILNVSMNMANSVRCIWCDKRCGTITRSVEQVQHHGIVVYS